MIIDNGFSIKKNKYNSQGFDQQVLDMVLNKVQLQVKNKYFKKLKNMRKDEDLLLGMLLIW